MMKKEEIISSVKILVDKRSQIKFLSKELNEHSHFNKKLIPQFFDKIFELLYPQSMKMDLEKEFLKSAEDLQELLKMFVDADKVAPITLEFFQGLSTISELLDEDAEAILQGDPAADSLAEVLLTYPGFFAISVYRLAHFFYQKNLKMLARILGEYAHEKTGIDIHPGAQIGRSFCIDHGTGIVIGETTIIGNGVKIFQSVTLGALSVKKKLQGKKRHPTIGNNCIIYASATILGGETIIGDNCIIGGNVWLTNSIPAASTVYHKAEIEFIKEIKK